MQSDQQEEILPPVAFFHSDLLCLELSASSRASSTAFAVGT